MKCFNPRARTGRDLARELQYRKIMVSIHAPARGATRTLLHSPAYLKFQSTRPHGARRRRKKQRRKIVLSFNPRARTGRDCFSGLNPVLLHCFNPRARTGATSIGFSYIGSSMFQSTRPHGARRLSTIFKLEICKGFNPRARTGRDKEIKNGMA